MSNVDSGVSSVFFFPLTHNKRGGERGGGGFVYVRQKIKNSPLTQRVALDLDR